MDRRIPGILAFTGILALLIVPRAPIGHTILSEDPHLEAFGAIPNTTAPVPVPVERRHVGPWTVRHAAVYPQEAFPQLETDALLLDPAAKNGSRMRAALSQTVTLPQTSPTVILRARNGALLAGVPVTYWREYCAASNVTVSITPVDDNMRTTGSRVIGPGMEELRVDAGRFAGRTVTVTAIARPGPATCGTIHSNIAYIQYFGVERGHIIDRYLPG